ncbi:MAG: FG-GAP-like repeat-containing protein [Gemmataceae bacterium]
MGSGVVAFDFNGDGFTDLLFINGCSWSAPASGSKSTPALFRNNGDGTFTNITAESGLDLELFGMGATAGDYDNDGFPDLFITAVGGNRLFHNEAGPNGRRFAEVTAAGGLSPSPSPVLPRDDQFHTRKDEFSFPSSATWLDFDGDGRLDLFVCYYVTWTPAFDLSIAAVLSNGNRAYVPPTQFTGTYCQLFRNVDGKRFEDVSESAGVRVFDTQGDTGTRSPVGKSLGVVACDFDNDGWPDLIVANDTVRNFYFQNVPDSNGGRRFQEIGMTSGVAYADGRPRGGMGVDVGEIRPGQDAFVVANFSNEPDTLMALVSPSRLLFQDRATAEGIAAPSRGPMKFAALFWDFDLDGELDLFTANGHLEPEIASVQSGQTYAQSPQLYRNRGQSRNPLFQPMTEKEVGRDLFQPCVGRGAAIIDFNGDGAPDLAIAVNGGKAKLIENRNTTGNHWIKLTLVGDGVSSNRDAIGADVTIEAGGRAYHRSVVAARGYLSQSELTITCGLGSTSKVDRIRVRWPGKNAGEQVWTNLGTKRAWILKQGQADAQSRN